MTTSSTTTLSDQLAKAIFTRDYALLEHTLDAGADVNAALDPYGSTPLARAIAVDLTECALLLIQRGAAVGKTRAGAMPLTIAASRDNVEVCRALLDAGAPIEDRCESGKTALYDASVRVQPAVCQLLIERGADVHAETAFSSTPLSAVSMSSNLRSPEVVRILVEGGADPSRLPSRGQDGNPPLSAFQVALVHGKTKHVEYFLRVCGEDPSQTTVDGRSMFDLAMTPDVEELLRSAIVERSVAAGLSDSAHSIIPQADEQPSPDTRAARTPNFGAL